jgi:hypothetical protein
LPLMKKERPSFAKVHEKPEFPRCREEHRYHSFCYRQSGFTFVGQ